MATLDQQAANQIANIEKSSGRSLADWIAIVHQSGVQKHSEVIAMLKEQGLTYGNANLIAIKAREAATGGAPSDEQLINSYFAGKNTELRPIFDAVVERVSAFGTDIELDPKKTYVSLRRKKQFGQVGPAAGQLEVCVNLPGKEPTGRWTSTSGMATHRVRISDIEAVDDELVGWLREAYERA